MLQYAQDAMVSTHSRPKAAGKCRHRRHRKRLVSTHSRPKAAGSVEDRYPADLQVSTHSRPKAAGGAAAVFGDNAAVSTHSRPKAAGHEPPRVIFAKSGFNTQPPEGGWDSLINSSAVSMDVSTHSRPKAAGSAARFTTTSCCLFQHTAARRRLAKFALARRPRPRFNTQPPEGGWLKHHDRKRKGWLRFNTQPPEGGWLRRDGRIIRLGSFNTQPPEGGWVSVRKLVERNAPVSTHSRPKAAGKSAQPKRAAAKFQHTAARRRLGPLNQLGDVALLVSTHSRPKAAGPLPTRHSPRQRVSTHSRPKAAG